MTTSGGVCKLGELGKLGGEQRTNGVLEGGRVQVGDDGLGGLDGASALEVAANEESASLFFTV